MKLLVVTILLFWLCICASSQDEKIPRLKKAVPLEKLSLDGPFPKECGNGFDESQIYDFRNGKILKILNENTVMFLQTSHNNIDIKRRFKLRLAGIKKGNKKTVKDFLKKVILGEEVSVWGNLRKASDKKYSGIIIGLNEYLLRSGMSRFEESNGNARVPRHKLCIFEQYARKAKRQKLGIWAN